MNTVFPEIVFSLEQGFRSQTFCERKRNFILFCAKKQLVKQSFANFIYRKFALSRFCVILCNLEKQILSKRLNKGVNCINQLSLRLHFFANNCNTYKGTDYLPTTLFCYLMRDGTIKSRCARSHTKFEQYFTNYSF